MYKKVKAFVEKNRMIGAGDTVVAGVSGGGDSMAMLYFLWEYKRDRDFTLLAVHVNHGIRGAEALRDQRLVEDACRRLGISCLVKEYDVPAAARERKLGLEETGRLLRREAFQEAAEPFLEKGRTVRVAVAHNRNDLAETMLHHLARGTGLRGLGGMDAVSGRVIRPFLCLERREIDDYLREREIPHVLDSTNLSDDYTRNRIRRHVLPLLEQEVNERAVAHLAEASLLLRQADEYLTAQARALLEECVRPEGGYFLGEDFFSREPILKSCAVLEAAAVLAGRRKDLTSVHVEQVLELYEKQSGRRAELPWGVTARRTVSGVVLERRAPSSESREEEMWELPVPGELSCPLGRFSAKIFSYEGQKILQKKCTKWLDYDKINRNIAVRTRRSGDYLIINREGNRKKLKKFLVDEKIPAQERDRLPLLACGPEVLWIAGGRMSEKYKITSGTQRVLELCYEEPFFGEARQGRE